MVTGAGAVVWLLVLQAQAPSVPLLSPGAALESPLAGALTEAVPDPGTLLHPVRLELDHAEQGWRIESLEVRLDGALLARQGQTGEKAAGTPVTPLEESWSGSVSDGDHVLSAVLLLRSTSARDADGRPLQLRVERARRFRAGASRALALQIQAPGGGGQVPQVVLSAHGR